MDTTSPSFPNPGAAPPFAGPVPPDRVQMGLGEYLNGALSVLRSGPLDPQEMMEFRAFQEAVSQIVQAKAAEQAAMQGQAGQGMSMNGPEEPFGTSAGAEDHPDFAYDETA